MLLRALSILSLFILPLSFGSAVAEDVVAENAIADIAKAQSEALNEKVVEILKGVTHEEAVHFMTMYGNYNIYSMVKAIRDDVEGAINGCIKNNKSMKDDLNDRFSDWNKNVSSSLKDTYEQVQNLALAQTYISQSELKIIFGLADEVRAVNSSRFETVPVTTPEACEFMVSKMDETERDMISMLRSTLVSYPNAVRKIQQ